MGERILVVEDEHTLCTNVARALGRAGHSVTAVESGRAAIDELTIRSFDLVITDLRLPDVDGLTVLDKVRETSPETVTLIMTAYASVDSAVEALRRGAHDYVLKPLSLADLERKVQNIADHGRLGRENARLRTLLHGDRSAIAMLRRGGRVMNELADAVEKFAAASANVLVLGESGAGKELVARALHECSPRATGPFITLDVGAIADTSIESTLFGHEKGAFPGAERAREGLFRAASGGTLFLDEVGELTPAVQAKLLRAVEAKEVTPVGADRGVHVDVRVVSATHRDLAAMVQAGAFRSDLLYRLQVGVVRIPPLRERPHDVPALALELLHQHARAQRKAVAAIAPDAMAILCAYTWPGNVRELSNVLERAVILCEGDVVTPIDLPTELGVEPAASPTSGEPVAKSAGRGTLEEATLAFQREHVARALDAVSGNREAAAKALGLSPATLYRYLQRLGLKGYASS